MYVCECECMCMCCVQGITFEEVKSFTEMLDSLSDVDMALGMFHAAGASVTQGNVECMLESYCTRGVKVSLCVTGNSARET